TLHDALPFRLNGVMQKRPLPIASVVLISRSSLLSSLFRRHIEKMPLQQVVMRLIGLKKLCRYGKKSIGKMVHNGLVTRKNGYRMRKEYQLHKRYEGLKGKNKRGDSHG